MLCQEALMNDVVYGDGHRRLVKSLSEAANTEGIHYDLYDLDKYPNARPIHNIRMQRPSSSDLAEEESYRLSPYDVREHSGSSDVFMEQSPIKYKKSVLHKTLSEGQILQEKKRAMTLSSGYVDVDINGYHGSEEDLIERHCVEECSVDLSHSRIFSQESLIDADIEDEECFHENMFTDDGGASSSEGRRVSVVSSDSDMKSVDVNELRNENHLQHQLDLISSEAPQILEEESPDVSPIEFPSIHDNYDGCEESVSESQVTVVQRKFGFGGSGYVLTSDSENGSNQVPEYSGKTLYVKQNSLHGSSLEEEDDEDVRKLRIPSSTTNLSNISDEQRSVSDCGITDSLHERASPSSTSSEYDKAIASSTDEYSSIVSGDSMTVKSDGFDRDFEDQDLVIEENYMDRLVQELKGSRCPPSAAVRKSPNSRRRASPESDSSSSHLTEHEASRKNVTSKYEISRTDPSTDQSRSETSDDYVSANESNSNDAESRKNLPFDERRVSSPPSMEDIVEDETLTPVLVGSEYYKSIVNNVENNDGVNSDFETAQDLTSPTSDSTTSASYHIDCCEEYDKMSDHRFKPDLPPKLIHPHLPKPTAPNKPERFSPCRESRERPLKLDGNKAIMTRTVSDSSSIKHVKDPSTHIINAKNSQQSFQQNNKQNICRTMSNMENKRFSRYFDIDSATEDSCDNHGDGEDSDSEHNKALWSREEKSKLKQCMKLDIPIGTSLYEEISISSNKNKMIEVRKQKISDKKLKNAVKINTNDCNLIQRSRSQSPKDNGACTTTANDRKANKDRSKSKTPEEVTTPGMVRSPAMREGFRMQDWTPLRTPATPDKAIDLETSEDSGTDHSPRIPKSRSPNRILKEQRRKSKELSRKGEDMPPHGDNSIIRRSPNWYNSSQEIGVPHARRSSPNIWQETRHSPNISANRRNSIMRESPIPSDADPKNECHSAMCTQCGERPASREGILRSTPSPQQMIASHPAHHQQFAHQFYVMQKSPSLPHSYHPEMSMSLPRPKPMPLRTRSEERSALCREWG